MRMIPCKARRGSHQLCLSFLPFTSLTLIAMPSGMARNARVPLVRSSSFCMKLLFCPRRLALYVIGKIGRTGTVSRDMGIMIDKHCTMMSITVAR